MIARSIAIACLVFASVVSAAAQSDPWLKLSPKPKDFVAARLPWSTFTIDLPKNWLVAPGFGGTLLNVFERGKPNQTAGAIVLEQSRLAVPLTANEIDAGLAELESDLARRRDPGGANFAQQVKEVDGRRFILVTYTRPGLNGTDSVVVYVFPNGGVMYRLICISPGTETLPKYQAVFAHVAASFRIAGASSN